MSRRAVPVRPLAGFPDPKVGVIQGNDGPLYGRLAPVQQSPLVPQDEILEDEKETQQFQQQQLQQQQQQLQQDGGFGLLTFGFLGSLGLVWAWFYLRRKRQQEADENAAFLHRLQNRRKKSHKRHIEGFMIDPSVLQNGAIYYPPPQQQVMYSQPQQVYSNQMYSQPQQMYSQPQHVYSQGQQVYSQGQQVPQQVPQQEFY